MSSMFQRIACFRKHELSKREGVRGADRVESICEQLQKALLAGSKALGKPSTWPKVPQLTFDALERQACC